jgi:succinate dehydrogenase / fumarate reductase cytochrome b subunit
MAVAERPSRRTTTAAISILKKALMALTGLLWFGYVIAHLLGNSLLWAGPEQFNGYAKWLAANPLVIPAEIVLVVTLLVHACTAWRVTNENYEARPQRYVVKVPSSGSSTFASRTMWYGGVILLIFLIVHVWMFKYGDHSGAHGLWGLVVRSFKNPWIALMYIVAMVPLGFHLSHGFSSAFQSLGVLPSHWRPTMRAGGQYLGWVIAGGFMLLTLWALFFAEV